MMLRRTFLKLLAAVGVGSGAKAGAPLCVAGKGVALAPKEGSVVTLRHTEARYTAMITAGGVVLYSGESAKFVDGVWRKV
jgi:hypothetical protein